MLKSKPKLRKLRGGDVYWCGDQSGEETFVAWITRTGRIFHVADDGQWWELEESVYASLLGKRIRKGTGKVFYV